MIKDYNLEPSLQPAQEDAATSTNSSLTQLRNKIFPENTSSAKFTTTLGPELSPVNGLIYNGTHESGLESGGVQRPLWVETDDLLFPTSWISLVMGETFETNSHSLHPFRKPGPASNSLYASSGFKETTIRC